MSTAADAVTRTGAGNHDAARYLSHDADYPRHAHVRAHRE
jgi:hypothetical protein